MHRRLLPLIGAGGGAIVACAAASAPSTSAPVADGGAGDAATCVFACGPTTTPEELDASLAARVRARLGTCSGIEGCHVSGAGGLSFPAAAPFSELVNVRSTERPELFRVAPFDPSASYLYLKVLGDGGIDGAPMPLGASYDPRIPATIFAWIEAGAPDD